jgi:hypothetical protein
MDASRRPGRARGERSFTVAWAAAHVSGRLGACLWARPEGLADVLAAGLEVVAEVVVGDLAAEGRAGLDGEAVVHSAPDAGVVDLGP